MEFLHVRKPSNNFTPQRLQLQHCIYSQHRINSDLKAEMATSASSFPQAPMISPRDILPNSDHNRPYLFYEIWQDLNLSSFSCNYTFLYQQNTAQYEDPTAETKDRSNRIYTLCIAQAFTTNLPQDNDSTTLFCTFNT